MKSKKMNSKDFGNRTNVLLGVALLLMIIGVVLGELSVGNKIIMIGLIGGLFSSRVEINRLKKIISSLKE